jgi:hypothetical protein
VRNKKKVPSSSTFLPKKWKKKRNRNKNEKKNKNNKNIFTRMANEKNCTPFRCGAHCRLAVLARSGERRVR